MSTNEDFAQRKGIDLDRIEVRTLFTKTGQFTKGLGKETYDLTYDVVGIYDRDTGRRLAGPIAKAPSTTLCLPDRIVKADAATDEELVLAVLGDEPIFPRYGGEEP